MNVSTKAIPLDVGSFTLEETVAMLEDNGPRSVTVAVTRQTGAHTGFPMVRLVGEPERVIAALCDGWAMTADEASSFIE